MGFSYNDITSKSMGLKARLTSWQVSGRLRNFTTTVPGKYGVTDFGADFDYVEDENGVTVRNGLPYLEELNFPTLSVGDNTVSVAVSNAVFTGLEIQARSRWR